ncbi:MAG: nickel pincer cofactor biosynthesis protein LarC [Anaerolineae bacterium]
MGRQVAYFDCFSGASGDMLLGCLLDAGLDLADLQAGLAKIGIAPGVVTAARYAQHGITGTRLEVHDQDAGQPARTLPTIRELLTSSSLDQAIIDDSLRIFTMIAEVEGAIHGLEPDQVHFHELSALDSLVDVVGFNIALHVLGIEAAFSSPLPLGHGSIRTAHGVLPLPAPATLALLARVEAPTIPSSAEAELVTPTGAGILTARAEFRQPAMAIRQIGYGFGMKEFAWANIVRVWLGHELDLPGARHGEVAPHHHHEADEAHSHEHQPHAHGHEHEHTHDQGGHGHSH